MREKFLSFLKNRLTATKEIDQNLTIFGIFLIIAYPGFYLINSLFVTPEGYENLSLRISIGLLGGILCLRRFWAEQFKKLVPIYMYLLLIYALPFFFFFMLFHNPTSNLWQLNTLVGLFLLFLFVSWVDAIILTLVGYAAAYYTSFLVFRDAQLPPDFFKLLIIYISPLVYISLFSNQKEYIQKEKQKSLRMQAGAIAHEMRTPLAAIRHMATGLKMHLPTLITAQQNLQEKDESIPYINDAILEPLKLIPTELERVSRSAFTVIDTLLLNLQDAPSKIVLEKCSILDCVETSLQAYSLTDEEKDLILLEIVENFELQTNPHLLKHVFFNLLKNSLHYVKAAGKGRIFIWTEKGEKFNRLHFKDTGKGIPPSILPYIFNQFYSRTDHGTGVGLAFCKMVLQKSGGDITCESVEGEFTHFTLSFPVVNE
ncbi:sensor histidine kinase [Candidatus Odyssella acanthamoebae]|nr:HAMP domain-containing sensor histidine kinase [Candidatus Paracaedibacter acanthamoebae]